MSNTSKQYDTIISKCEDIFSKKTKDYGTAWRILRTSSLTDQIFIKAQRIRSLQTQTTRKVDEGEVSEFIGIVNYSVMALIQIKLGVSEQVNMNLEVALKEYDEQIQIPEADRKQKQKIVSELYDMIESLAYAVFQVDAYMAYASTSKKRKLETKLTELKESMVITTGDNYVGAAEPQLREKMTTLFQKVENNYGAPTANELENLETIHKYNAEVMQSLKELKKKYKLENKVPLKSFEVFLRNE